MRSTASRRRSTSEVHGCSVSSGRRLSKYVPLRTANRAAWTTARTAREVADRSTTASRGPPGGDTPPRSTARRSGVAGHGRVHPGDAPARCPPSVSGHYRRRLCGGASDVSIRGGPHHAVSVSRAVPLRMPFVDLSPVATLACAPSPHMRTRGGGVQERLPVARLASPYGTGGSGGRGRRDASERGAESGGRPPRRHARPACRFTGSAFPIARLSA